jgi:altronate hydrolase
VASGCHIVLFSTGTGIPYGSFVPTLKISTNDVLAKNKPHWINFNVGVLLNGAALDEMLDRFIDIVIDVVDGEPTCNEKNGFRELAIFKSGLTL